MAFLIKTNQ